jgi:hypothetical protein
MQGFLTFYCYYLLAVTLYVVFFITEKPAQNTTDEVQNSEQEPNNGEPEPEVTIGMTVGIFKDILMNKNTRIFYFFVFVYRFALSVQAYIGKVYLTDDLGYDKIVLSQMRVICTPISIMLCSRFGYLAKQEPFENMFRMAVLYVIMCSYYVLVLLYTMPTSKEEQESTFVYCHMLVVSLIFDVLGEIESTIVYGILFKRTDKRCSAIHVTIFASLLNMTYFMHKLYIYYLVEYVSIFLPQIVFSTIAAVLIMRQRESLLSLKDVEPSGWHISNHVLGIKNKAE